MPSSRYKANSRYISIEAYPFALPCGERIEGERIDASVVDIKTERIRCPAVDIKKRTGDPSPLESSPEGETDRCVLESDGRLCPNFRLEKIDFCLVFCTATGGPPQALVPVSALPDHGLGLLHFSL